MIINFKNFVNLYACKSYHRYLKLEIVSGDDKIIISKYPATNNSRWDILMPLEDAKKFAEAILIEVSRTKNIP